MKFNFDEDGIDSASEGGVAVAEKPHAILGTLESLDRPAEKNGEQIVLHGGTEVEIDGPLEAVMVDGDGTVRPIAEISGDPVSEESAAGTDEPAATDAVAAPATETEQAAPVYAEFAVEEMPDNPDELAKLIADAEIDCRRQEYEITDLKEELKQAKKRLEKLVARVRRLAGRAIELEQEKKKEAPLRTSAVTGSAVGEDDAHEAEPIKCPVCKTTMWVDGGIYRCTCGHEETPDCDCQACCEARQTNSQEAGKLATALGAVSGSVVGDDESWRTVLLSTLDISPGSIKALSESGLNTIGELADFTNGGKQLVDVPGIGKAKGEKIEDAMTAFWAGRK